MSTQRRPNLRVDLQWQNDDLHPDAVSPIFQSRAPGSEPAPEQPILELQTQIDALSSHFNAITEALSETVQRQAAQIAGLEEIVRNRDEVIDALIRTTAAKSNGAVPHRVDYGLNKIAERDVTRG